MLGFINVYKEKDWTSHDVVAKMRGILGTKKIGHAGTLDPQVEGVLVLAVGQATKLMKYLEASDKEYRVEMTFGFETDTQDLQGNVTQSATVDPSVFLKLDQVLESMQGKIMQIPPMYSAIKINGQKLYQLARKGQEVERPPRSVNVKEIFNIKGPWCDNQGLYRLAFNILCSKGTYVRTYCQDLARALGTLGVMSDLMRTRVGPFHYSKARTLTEIGSLIEDMDGTFIHHPIDILPLPMVTVIEKSLIDAISHGQSIKQSEIDLPKDLSADSELMIISEEKKLLALAILDENIIKMKRVFIHERP